MKPKAGDRLIRRKREKTQIPISGKKETQPHILQTLKKNKEGLPWWLSG